MQETEFMNLWKSLDERMNETLHLNRLQAEEITRLKIKSLLGSIRPSKVFAVVVGLFWIAFVDVLLVATFHVAGPLFWWSALFQVVLCKVAVGIYVYQLILVEQTDLSEPILRTQERLAWLKASTLWVARILFLQLPAWTTFYLSWTTLRYGHPVGLAIQAVATGLATFAAVWLFVQIREKNRNTRWFRLLFSGREWEPLLKSMDLLEQIRGYQGTRTS